MKENLYGIILATFDPILVLSLLKKLDQAGVDYIMPIPGAVAVLGRDLLRVHNLVRAGTYKRVIKWSGDPDPKHGWWVSSGRPDYLSDIYGRTYLNLGPRLRFTYDNYPLFVHSNEHGVTTIFPNHFHWKKVLSIIYQYGFKDEDIRSDDPIWKMAD